MSNETPRHEDEEDDIDIGVTPKPVRRSRSRSRSRSKSPSVPREQSLSPSPTREKTPPKQTKRSRDKSPQSRDKSPQPNLDRSPQPIYKKKRPSQNRSHSPEPPKKKYRSRSPKPREDGEIKEFKAPHAPPRSDGPYAPPGLFQSNPQGSYHVNPRGPHGFSNAAHHSSSSQGSYPSTTSHGSFSSSSSSQGHYPYFQPRPMLPPFSPATPVNNNVFAYGSLIVLLVDEKVSPAVFEKEWKSVFHRHRYQMYDYLYPFRIASRTILRQNPGYRQKTSYTDAQTEGLTLHLGRETAKFMNENFIYDYFHDWMTNLKPHQKERIVLFGLSTGRGSQIAIDRIRQMGGIVISTPNMSGDVHVNVAKDVDDFLKSLVRPAIENNSTY